MAGVQNWTNDLWDIIVPQASLTTINMIVQKDETKHELVEYLHKCVFSPAFSTFQKVIRKGHFITWPGINKITFEKIITNKTPTAKEHLDQERSNLQSTKITKVINDDEEEFSHKMALKKKLECSNGLSNGTKTHNVFQSNW